MLISFQVYFFVCGTVFFLIWMSLFPVLGSVLDPVLDCYCVSNLLIAPNEWWLLQWSFLSWSWKLRRIIRGWKLCRFSLRHGRLRSRQVRSKLSEKIVLGINVTPVQLKVLNSVSYAHHNFTSRSTQLCSL